MTVPAGKLTFLPCLDSGQMAADRRRELGVSHEAAEKLGKSALEAARVGVYTNAAGEPVEWHDLVEVAVADKVSLSPDHPLPDPGNRPQDETRVQVTNETTLLAAQRLVANGLSPLALNFANGVQPGGGFLYGARAQEEVLCRSSALFETLVDDPMYDHHRQRGSSDSTDWAILSPRVPIFRADDGTPLDQPWLLDFLTCAAPYAPDVGQPESGDLLKKRIHRVLAIAQAYGYRSLVLGAWGCGAFANDPQRTAIDFRHALETEFAGIFTDIVFAITDWSADRKTLGPFRDVFREMWPRLDVQLYSACGVGFGVTLICRRHFMFVPVVFAVVQFLVSSIVAFNHKGAEPATIGYLFFWLLLLAVAPSLIGSVLSIPAAAGIDGLLGIKQDERVTGTWRRSGAFNRSREDYSRLDSLDPYRPPKTGGESKD